MVLSLLTICQTVEWLCVCVASDVVLREVAVVAGGGSLKPQNRRPQRDRQTDSRRSGRLPSDWLTL